MNFLKKLSLTLIWLALLWLVGILVYTNDQECTLFSAIGSRVVNNGMILAKNRDEKPDHIQEVRRVIPSSGYRYVGLYAVEDGSASLKAGANEHGLVIVSATASTIPKEERTDPSGTSLSMKQCLIKYRTVDEVVMHAMEFKNSCFYMVGDSHKIAYIEVAKESRVSVSIVENGTLAHTNHFLKLTYFNYGNIPTSSKKRYSRIVYLLKSYKGKFDINTFYSFCKDQNAGPDNSIFRTGTSSRTLAHFIFYVSSTQKTLYIKLYNPNEEPVSGVIELNEEFWK